MCGILGSINVNFKRDVLNLIAHRGPDDCGMETFSLNGNTVIFAQTRLSIVELSEAGHQPMISPCGNFSLIFNGEVYNHIELRAELASSIKYRGSSDTETILHYLIQKGIEALKELNGIFALAFFDKTKEKVTLARDPFGVKPIYYWYKNEQLVFSSEIRPIKEIVPNLHLDKLALAELLRLRYNPSPDTLYEEIRKLPPGAMITCELSSNMNSKLENFGIQSVQRNSDLDLEMATIQYGKLLEMAVKRQLMADVEIGILLSGGIDSALIATIAKKYYNGNLKAFTIGFDGEHQEDEILEAKETANYLEIEHIYRKISFTDFLSTIQECTRIVEEPLGTTSVIPMYYLAQLAANHVKVVLSGQGVDEPFGGYSRYKMELIRDIIPTWFHPLICKLIKLSKTQNEQFLRAEKVLHVKDELSRFLTTYELFSNQEIFDLIGIYDNVSIKRIEKMRDLISGNGTISATEKMLSMDTRMNLSDDLLNYTDKITMHFALECRVPILDIELVHFIESLPTHLKLNRKIGKVLHRKYAESVLPLEIVNRPKKGFQSPTREWFRNEMASIKQILLNDESNFLHVFNKQAVSTILEEHIQGYNKEKQIFLFLSIYYWLQENNSVIQ